MSDQPTAQEHFASYRRSVIANDEAHRRAWQETVARIEQVREHIQEQNLGLAKDALSALLEDLPHDHGAQEFFLLLDRKREQVTNR